MTNKDLRRLISNIHDSESTDILSEIAIKMRNIVVNNPHISIEDKMLYLFLHFQHREECVRIAVLLLNQT